MLPKIITPITDLQKQTVTQLRAALVPTKRDALIQANGGFDKIMDEPVRKYREDGQIEFQSETLRDVETNAVVSTKTIAWTYYETGEVDEITTTENKKTKKIKHFLNGKLPVIEAK